MNLSVNIFLLWGTWQDIKKRSITGIYLMIGEIGGLFFNIIKMGKGIFSFEQWILALVPGVIFLIFAKATKEKIGFGDGMLLFLLGNFYTVGKVCMILQIALMFLLMFSTILWCSRKVSVDYQVPFLPFLWISHSLLWGLNYV